MYESCTLKTTQVIMSEPVLTDRQTDGEKDRQTLPDSRTIQTLDAPGLPFRPGHKNFFFYSVTCPNWIQI